MTWSNGQSGADCSAPDSYLTVDAAGNIYGEAGMLGGTGGEYDGGMVWEYTATGTYKDLHDFAGPLAWFNDGWALCGGVTFDAFGNMYGMAALGGANRQGMLWEITSAGQYVDLHDFGGKLSDGDSDGAQPYGNVSIDTVGNLYGTTSAGGPNDGGVLWKLPSWISALSLSPRSVAGGSPGTGTITLASPAPSGGLTVNLSSSNPAVAVNSSVTVPAGQTSLNFVIGTSTVNSNITATITANYNSGFQQAQLTVTPAAVPVSIISVTMASESLVGGTSTTGTVYINAPAPQGGGLVNLSSNNPVILVPATVIVPAGQTSSNFTVNTTGVIQNTWGMITATSGGTQQTAGMSVNAPTLNSLSLSTSTVVCGSSATGAVQIDCTAPAGGFVVTLSSNSSAASVPATVTIPPGSNSASFPIETSDVSSPVWAMISASLGYQTQQSQLQIAVPSLTALTLSPSSVVGGTSATGTVTIGSPAPQGGTIVSLTCYSANAGVPATVTIPAGSTSATFRITTSATQGSMNATIMASLGYTNQQVNLTINPS